MCNMTFQYHVQYLDFSISGPMLAFNIIIHLSYFQCFLLGQFVNITSYTQFFFFILMFCYF